MVKLITHSSLLKADDVRLKAQPISARRLCNLCNHAARVDVSHLILQCHTLQCRHIIPALNVWASRAKYTTACQISTHFSLALMHV